MRDVREAWHLDRLVRMSSLASWAREAALVKRERMQATTASILADAASIMRKEEAKLDIACSAHKQSDVLGAREEKRIYDTVTKIT